MGLQLRPSPNQVADFKRIVELGPESLAKVQAGLAGLNPIPLDLQALRRAINEVIGAGQAEPLLRQILSLRSVVRRAAISVEDVVAGLDEALAAEDAKGKISFADWNAIRGNLIAIIELECVRLAAAAIELSYDYANLLLTTKILTDIRPLYNDAADRIQGAVVSFTLRLRYSNADGEHDLSIALDEDDIEALEKRCKRAVTKAATARALMTGTCHLSVANNREVEDA